MAVARQRFRSRIAMLAGVSVVLDLVAAGLAKVFEHGAHARASRPTSTPCSGRRRSCSRSRRSCPNPERTATKVLDVVLEAWAIIVVASLAATFSDLLHHRTRHRAMRERRAASRSPDLR